MTDPLIDENDPVEMKALMIEFFSRYNDGCKGEKNGL